MIKSDYIVFDVETGGLDENKNPITQYAAVILDGCTLKEKDSFETFIKPYGDLQIDQKALDMTMVTMADVNSGVTVEQFCSVVTKWWESYRVGGKSREMGRLVPVGHNVQFDIRFINKALEIGGVGKEITEWAHPNHIDTFPLAKLAWGITGDEKLNLTACCNRSKINLKDAHGAMNDVKATADLLRWYMKKLRKKSGDASANDMSSDRPRGNEFFEFTCK